MGIILSLSDKTEPLLNTDDGALHDKSGDWEIRPKWLTLIPQRLFYP